MNKKRMSLIASLCLLAPLAWAELAITPTTAAKMQNVFIAFTELEERNPDINIGDEEEGLSLFTAEGRKQIIDDLNASPLKNDVLNVLKINGFESPESFYDFVSRVAAASIAVNSDFDDESEPVNMMEDYASNLKQQGVPSDMVESMLQELQSERKETQAMMAAAKAARSADIEALRKHPEIMNMLVVD